MFSSLGTKSVPRIWDKWNLKALEPNDMRKDEQIKQDASKGPQSAAAVPIHELQDEFDGAKQHHSHTILNSQQLKFIVTF